MNVLFTNAGRRTYLIEYALHIRAVHLPELNVFVADSSEDVAAMWVDPVVTRLLTPRVSADPAYYADALLAICRERGIDLIIPLMDYELPVLSVERSRFAQHGVDILVSDPGVVHVGLNKKATYQWCADAGFAIPRTRYEGEDTSGIKPPLLLKPVEGSGSVGMHFIDNEEKLPARVPQSYILQEHIVGDEYGMDVLNDLSSAYVHCCVKKKIEMRAGETDKAEVVYRDEFTRLGAFLGQALRHRGNLDVDFMVTDTGECLFIDFNPRFGGGYPFTHAAGFNYLHYLIAEKEGHPIMLPKHGKRISGAKGLCLYSHEVD